MNVYEMHVYVQLYMSTNVSNFVYVQIVYKLFACLYTFKSAPLRNASLREKVARIQNLSFCIRFEFYVYVKKCASTKWCLYVEKTPTDEEQNKYVPVSESK